MIEVRIERSWAKLGFNMWIMERKEGKTFLVKPIHMEVEEKDDAFMLPEPSLFLNHDQAIDFFRGMASELRRHGYEVIEPDGIAQELKATKFHLEDMRKLALEKK